MPFYEIMIQTIIDFILHADVYLASIIQNYGSWVYIFLFLIIFLETGLVIMPFLPGDSLIFVAGTFASTGALNIFFLFFLISAAAILGDTVNYWMGSYFGEKVFSRFIRREHMEKTKMFFHNYGKKTIVIARFVPIVRTFAPFVAGIGKMNYLIFLSYNVIGGILWVVIFVFAGFFFGNIPFVKDNLSVIVLVIIALSVVPFAIEYIRSRRKKSSKELSNQNFQM